MFNAVIRTQSNSGDTKAKKFGKPGPGVSHFPGGTEHELSPPKKKILAPFALHPALVSDLGNPRSHWFCKSVLWPGPLSLDFRRWQRLVYTNLRIQQAAGKKKIKESLPLPIIILTILKFLLVFIIQVSSISIETNYGRCE